MYCRNCGAQNNDGAAFCKKCGAKMKAGTTPREEKTASGTVPRAAAADEYVDKSDEYYRGSSESNMRSTDVTPTTEMTSGQNHYQIPDEYRPIGMWGYFGYSLLFSIPIVGIICELVFAFGGTKNMNLRNFARAQFCMVIVVIVLLIIIVMTGAGALSSMYW